MNSRIPFTLAALILPCVFALHAFAEEKPKADDKGKAPPKKNEPKKNDGPHEKMDYGPFLGASVESTYPAANNIALKGMAIRLGDKKQAAVSFDMEMLRYSVGWTGEYLGLNYGRDGLADHPRLKGTPKFGTKGTSLGWAKDGKFEDPRAKDSKGRAEGPLPNDFAKYKGVYLDGRNVVLHYTVGDADVMEQPGFDDADGIDVFSRTIQIGKSSKPLTMLLMEDDKADASSSAAANRAALILKDPKSTDTAIMAALSGAPVGVTFALDGKRVLVNIPALTAPAKFTITICHLPSADKAKFEAAASKKVASVDFDVIVKTGGAPRWKTIEVKGTPAKADDQAYVVDSITVPFENEYNSYMRITGIDFFKDGRAAVCTMSGDVWVISGIDKTLEKITWQRYASGLFATTGLKIVNDQVYTLGRDQITRFYDLNKDGEADYYECFNNDCTVGPDYHEFAHDLHTDTDGNFYYMKGSNLSSGGAKFHGVMVRVDKNGEKAEMFCKGFRAPNGMCVGPHNEITTGDNQGNWTPASPINWVKKDGFYGFQLDQYPETKKGPRENPLCWVPYDEDNSCGGQVWGGPNWGPLSNRLLHMSYGKCKLFAAVIEKYGDEVQGGVTKFPLEFASGIMRARVNPVDGQVYVVGMKGWQTSAPNTGCVQRVRYTGKPYNAPMETKVTTDGMTITFNEKLDPKSVDDATNWDVRRFNVKYSKAYGSEEYSLEDPTKHHKCGLRSERDVVEVKSAKLDADGKTVKLTLANVKPCTNMIVTYKIQTADGTTLKQDLDYTVNFIQGGAKFPGMVPPDPTTEEPKKNEGKKKKDEAKKKSE
ncbi:MAG: DUF6797 domain-containing protein [Planctomycetota bacterium]